MSIIIQSQSVKKYFNLTIVYFHIKIYELKVEEIVKYTFKINRKIAFLSFTPRLQDQLFPEKKIKNLFQHENKFMRNKVFRQGREK